MDYVNKILDQNKLHNDTFQTTVHPGVVMNGDVSPKWFKRALQYDIFHDYNPVLLRLCRRNQGLQKRHKKNINKLAPPGYRIL